MFKKLALLLAVIAATGIGATMAHAQPYERTWVSGTGSDANPCNRTAPCLTFAGAIANTSSGGEIDCLDAGGFGSVTISMAVTIDCEGVSYGAIQVSSGVAITIGLTTGAVNLFGLDINGENSSGGAGVLIESAAIVNIRNCKIYGFSSSGIGEGILFHTITSGGSLVIDNVFIANNATGISQTSVTSGVTNTTVRNSNINNNGIGIQVAVSGGTHAGATIEQTTLAFNSQDGLLVSGTGAIAVLGGSTVVNNGTGVATSGGGTVYSFKNNQIGGNSSDGTPLTAYPGGPLN